MSPLPGCPTSLASSSRPRDSAGCSRAPPPGPEQQKDLDFLLTLGELFTLIPYGQLICEQASLRGLATDTVDQIFDVFVRDFSAYAVALHGKGSATEAQRAWVLESIREPVLDEERFDGVWEKVRSIAGAYEMRP